MNNAANISRKYGNYDCVSCITELALSLPGKILKIDVRTVTHTRPFIMHVSLYQDSAISDTGIHYGFLYDGKVYDNIHHDGIERSIWVTNFIFLIQQQVGSHRLLKNM